MLPKVTDLLEFRLLLCNENLIESEGSAQIWVENLLFQKVNLFVSLFCFLSYAS